MTRLADALAAVAEIVAGLLTLAIFCVMLAQIWFRFVLNDSLLWTEEVASWALIWLVFLGAASVARDWGHVRVPLFVDLLPAGLRLGVNIACKLCVVFLAVFMAWLGFYVHGDGFHRMSTMIGLSTKWAKLAIPVGLSLLASLTLVSLAEDLRKAGRGHEAGD